MEENKPGSSNTIRSNEHHEHEDGLDDDRGSAHGSGYGGEDRNQSQPVAEFLYQLTKMLTDDNSEIIEWTDGRIKVHYPERLEGEVLHKYFRHSKCTSSLVSSRQVVFTIVLVW
jgi:HSF-type DNA-binding